MIFTHPSGEFDINILFEDDDLLIVDKPPGLPTQGTVDRKRANLYDLLRNSGKWKYLALHHRLDVPTSGVLLLVKNQNFNKAIAEAFKNKLIQKTYFCITNRAPEWSETLIENHVKGVKLKNGKTKMQVVNSGGDFSQTRFKVIRKNLKAALVQAQPLTGRMHQIRIHMSCQGLPILGDALYGRVNPEYKRLLLHAGEIEFSHPRTKKMLRIQSPLPEDFTLALEKLELHQ